MLVFLRALLLLCLCCSLIPTTTTGQTDDEEYNAILAQKLKRGGENITIPGDYVVVLNKTRVEEVRQAVEDVVEELRRGTNEEAVALLRAWAYVRMAKISVSGDERYSDRGSDAATRRLWLLRAFLESDLEENIEEDQYASTQNDQEFPPWGLDRIDQETGTNNQYHYDFDGTGVTAYILDTGIRTSHEDFGGRATCPFSAIPLESCEDGNGHGTHVAGTVGGTVFGVGKNVELVGVKVLANSGDGANSGVIDGVNFVIDECRRDRTKKCVANMSLGGLVSLSLDRAVNDLVQSGVFTSVAAGNDNINACINSPARSNGAMTVGATDDGDRRASFSNFGDCVDIFAPGVDILSAGIESDTDDDTKDGTSMASPHVAGVAALWLESGNAVTPLEIKSAILDHAVAGVVVDALNSPNLLLNTEALFTSTPAEAPESAAFSRKATYLLSAYLLVGISL